MVEPGSVGTRGRRRFDPMRVAVWVRRVTMLALIALVAWCWVVYGVERVPAGMNTVPSLPADSFCVVDRRASAATVGRDVFYRADGVLLVSRVVAVDGDRLTVHNPDANAPWPDSRAFGAIERSAVVGTVLFAIAETGQGRRGG